jgi:protein TonB
VFPGIHRTEPLKVQSACPAAQLPSISAVITGFLAHDAPRLPRRPLTAATPFVVAGLVHLIAVAALALVLPHAVIGPGRLPLEAAPAPAVTTALPRIVFIAGGPPGGGGGGGGNRQPGPIRHAEGVGRDAATLRVAKPRAPAVARDVEPETPLPALQLDARPLASGRFDQLGLPVGGVSYGTSTGSGSGGGVGTGTGTGIGSGTGPGIGPGSGGGTGGGVYRPGGAVTAPRLLLQVKPTYTNQALAERIQGSVWLEIVVTREGRVSEVRVVRSIDPRGLDEQAIAAVRQWQFEPGRLAGTPVEVAVTVAMDFSIR